MNCVWDRYREELEEWAEARGQVDRKLLLADGGGANADQRAARNQENGPGRGGSFGVDGMDDGGGGGSETNWAPAAGRARRPRPSVSPSAGDAGSGGGGDLFADVPVGIREFMKIEKRLKENKAKKRRREEDAKRIVSPVAT